MSKTATASPAWAYPYVLKLVNTTNSIAAKATTANKQAGEKVSVREKSPTKTSKRD